MFVNVNKKLLVLNILLVFVELFILKMNAISVFLIYLGIPYIIFLFVRMIIKKIDFKKFIVSVFLSLPIIFCYPAGKLLDYMIINKAYSIRESIVKNKEKHEKRKKFNYLGYYIICSYNEQLQPILNIQKINSIEQELEINSGNLHSPITK